jgi:hypothetical protein
VLGSLGDGADPINPNHPVDHGGCLGRDHRRGVQQWLPVEVWFRSARCSRSQPVCGPGAQRPRSSRRPRSTPRPTRTLPRHCAPTRLTILSNKHDGSGWSVPTPPMTSASPNCDNTWPSTTPTPRLSTRSPPRSNRRTAGFPIGPFSGSVDVGLRSVWRARPGVGLAILIITGPLQ